MALTGAVRHVTETNNSAYQGHYDPLTGDLCRKLSVVEIGYRHPSDPTLVRTLVLTYVRHGNPATKFLTSVVLKAGFIRKDEHQAHQVRLDLIEHDYVLTTLAIMLGATREQLLNVIREHAPY